MRSAHQEPHALYRVYDDKEHLLYIGCSNSPLSRMKSHEKRKAWATRIAFVRLEWFGDKASAMNAEVVAIATELPEWNVHHRENPKHSRGRLNWDFDHSDPSTWVKGSARSRKDAIQ